MVKHTQTIRRLLGHWLNCLIVFDHFVGFVLKGLGTGRSFRKVWQVLTAQ